MGVRRNGPGGFSQTPEARPPGSEVLMAAPTIAERLKRLEAKYAHDLLPTEERLELRERILKLKKKATIEAGRS